MGREIIIGDIHGCHDELMQLLDKVGVQEEDRVISVGDLVDRGPDSLKVWEFFRDRPNSVVIMGNHERKHLRGVLTYAQEIVKLQFGEQYKEFLDWLTKQSYYYESEHDNALVVHAAFENGVALTEQRKDVLSGTTSGTKYLEELYSGSEWHERYSDARPIIFGHHIVGDDPLIANNKTIFGIDTGACHGMNLTALVLPGYEIVQVKAERDYWEEEKTKWQVPVLRAKPWKEYHFGKLVEEIDRFGNQANNNADVKDYIAKLDNWRKSLENLISGAIYESLIQKQEELLTEHGESDFSKAASQLPHRSYLFMARHGRLSVQTMRKTLSTPTKVIGLAEQLGLLGEDGEASIVTLPDKL